MFHSYADLNLTLSGCDTETVERGDKQNNHIIFRDFTSTVDRCVKICSLLMYRSDDW